MTTKQVDVCSQPYFVLWESSTTLLTVFDVVDDPRRSRVVGTRREGEVPTALEQGLRSVEATVESATGG